MGVNKKTLLNKPKKLKKQNKKKHNIRPPPKTAGPMIRIGREIQCLPYAVFFFQFFKQVMLIFVKSQEQEAICMLHTCDLLPVETVTDLDLARTN